MHKNIELLNRACGNDTWITIKGTDWNTLVMREGFTKPTSQHWDAVRDEVEQEFAARAYIAQRAAAYPPLTEYLDGVVKGDQAQIDTYLAACREVKLKYPKP